MLGGLRYCIGGVENYQGWGSLGKIRDSTSGIDTEGEARGTIPEGNEVLPKR